MDSNQLEIITEIGVVAASLVGLSAYIVRLIIKLNFKGMFKYFFQYKFIIDESKCATNRQKNLVRFTLKNLTEDEKDILRFVYHRIPQMKLFLWGLLVPINLVTTPLVILYLINKTVGKVIDRNDFLEIFGVLFVGVLIQTVFIIIVEKGKVEFDELKGTNTES